MLSKKTKYGIKALIYIARQDFGAKIPVNQITKHECISQKFLESILLSLKKGGFLGAKKGKGGGYYLLKSPKEIKMTEIIRHLEGPIALISCVSLNFYEKCDDCEDETTCGIHKMMIQVRDNTLKVFKNTSLYALANPNEEMN